MRTHHANSIAVSLSKEVNTLKIAIVGSRTYENRLKIKEMIFKLKNAYGDKLEIVSGGANAGADKYARKYAIELGVTYKEFNPAHTQRNLYSVMPEEFFGKPYHVSQLFHRNTLIVKYCDKMIAFVDSKSKTGGTAHAIKEAQKHNKPVIIVSEK
jgi:predicted Rossmann fold nucleotide-binding protein DprA/Smf involved in DNA uptake